MGTSADYSAPPSWGPIKRDITKAGGRKLSKAQAGSFLRDHLSSSGGSSRIVRGGGTLGSSRAAQQIARSLGDFITHVQSVGLDGALEKHELGDLIGKSAQETLLGIVSICGGNGGSFDAVDARSALSRLMDELCTDTQTSHDVESVLLALTDESSLCDLLMRFFAFYIFEQFCRTCFKHLVSRHGEDRAESFLKDILDFIDSKLKNETLGIPASKIKWSGAQGKELSTKIMQQTLEVFEH